MKITKLEYQKKDPNRVNVYVDDQFAVGLDLNDLLKFGLYSGQEINSEHLAKIIAGSQFGKLYNATLNFLSFRPRSEWEIKQHYFKNDPKLLQEVLEKLKKNGLIDDEKFARWLIEQRQTFKPQGQRALRFELQRKGISATLITKVLSEEAVSEEDLAMIALEKKFSKMNFTDLAKMQRFLAARGFSWEVIKKTLAKKLGKKYNEAVD